MARQQAAELQKITDPVQRAAFMKFYERQVVAVDFIKHHSNKTILITLPLMAFIFWLYYRKGRIILPSTSLQACSCMAFAHWFLPFCASSTFCLW
jgi:hypothetical protein